MLSVRRECTRLLAATLFALPLVLAGAAHADAPPAPQPDAHQAAMEEADAIIKAGHAGPASIPLGKEGTLALPAGYLFIAADGAAKLMKQMGNTTGPTLRGMVVGHDEAHAGQWFVVINYIDSGHIAEDDADTWKADDLLKSLRDGTEEANKERKQMGAPEIEIDGWIQPPTYDKTTHRLTWSLGGHDKGSQADGNGVVNYNTYQLGREGYYTLNLVTDRGSIDAQKPFAHELLAATAFGKDNRYEDFNPKTDHVAEYGLAALVAGVALKKLGLLAGLGLMLAKAWKLIVVGIVALGAAAKKLLGKKNDVA